MSERFPGSRQEQEIPEWLQNIKSSYEVLRGELGTIYHELGYTGRINQESRGRRNQIIFDFIQEHLEEVPEFIPLLKPQEGEPGEHQIGSGKFQMTMRTRPRKSALYFLPHTFETYQLDPPGTDPDSPYLPESDNFKGIEEIKKEKEVAHARPIEQKMEGIGGLSPGHPLILDQKMGYLKPTINEADTAVSGKEQMVKKILGMLENSFAGEGKKELLRELQTKLDYEDKERKRIRDEEILKILPRYKRRLEILLAQLQENSKLRVPKRMEVHEWRAGLSYPTSFYFNPDKMQLLDVPKKKGRNLLGKEVEKEDFALARNASDEQWIAYADSLAQDILQLLPEEERRLVKFG